MLNWLQEYNDTLFEINTEKSMKERIELLDEINEVFDLENDEYWRELYIRDKANSLFNLGKEKEASDLIEDYLKIKPTWVWGYVEMADWYNDMPCTQDKIKANIEKAKAILKRCLDMKGAEKFDDIDVIIERYKILLQNGFKL